MKTVSPARGAFLMVLGLAAALPLCAAEPADPPPPPPEDLITAPRRLDARRLGEPWSDLLAALQAKGNIHASFTENRFLPFKKIPVVFKGEIRLSREHGLSLHYLSPEERTIVVDAQGVLMRDTSGRTREMPSDPRALAATSALLHVMRFDFAELEKTFESYASGTRELWFFGFEPKDESVSRSLSRILVTGEGDEVRRITMRKSSLQSVEILIGTVRPGVTFSPEDLQRYYR